MEKERLWNFQGPHNNLLCRDLGYESAEEDRTVYFSDDGNREYERSSQVWQEDVRNWTVVTVMGWAKLFSAPETHWGIGSGTADSESKAVDGGISECKHCLTWLKWREGAWNARLMKLLDINFNCPSIKLLKNFSTKNNEVEPAVVTIFA